MNGIQIGLRDRVQNAFKSAKATNAVHAGLLLDRGLPSQGGEHPPGVKDNVHQLGRVSELSAGAVYADAYKRRRAALVSRINVARVEMQVASRLIVGLGNESVLETAVTLQHTYGTPIIPGSALKGLARHYAAQVLAGGDSAEAGELREGGDYARVLFGTTEGASHITFFDAWYVPGSAPDDRPLARDVITVHHPQYYTKPAERRAPWDFDDPNPVPFLSARGRYLIAIDGPTPEWARFALDLLIHALEDSGAGGKTNAGYGRFVRHGDVEQGSSAPMPAPAAAPADAPNLEPPAMAHPMISRLERLPARDLKTQSGQFVDAWRREQDSRARVALARAIVARIDAANERRWASGKPWWAEIEAFLAAQDEPHA